MKRAQPKRKSNYTQNKKMEKSAILLQKCLLFWIFVWFDWVQHFRFVKNGYELIWNDDVMHDINWRTQLRWSRVMNKVRQAKRLHFSMAEFLFPKKTNKTTTFERSWHGFIILNFFNWCRSLKRSLNIYSLKWIFQQRNRIQE